MYHLDGCLQQIERKRRPHVVIKKTNVLILNENHSKINNKSGFNWFRDLELIE